MTYFLTGLAVVFGAYGIFMITDRATVPKNEDNRKAMIAIASINQRSGMIAFGYMVAIILALYFKS